MVDKEKRFNRESVKTIRQILTVKQMIDDEIQEHKEKNKNPAKDKKAN